MRGVAVAAFFVAQGMVAFPCFSQPSSETVRLLKIIEDQQRRLDAQEAQLLEHKKALQELRKEVEAFADRSQLAPSPSVPTGHTTTASYPGVKDPEDWPGSIPVPRTDTRFKISGFTELDVIHDTNDVQTPTAFVTQAIRTRGPKEGDSQTSLSVQATRLALETRTPLQGSTRDRPRRVTTVFEVDFFQQSY
jgi:hypothetical protein